MPFSTLSFAKIFVPFVLLDMKKYAVFLALALALCGCDGHVRSFRPYPTAARTGSSSELEQQKLVDALSSVASQRGYTASEPRVESDAYAVIASFWKRLDRDSVQIRLLKDAKTGRYEVVLIDWPSFVRSSESVAAEAAIREKLGEH